MRIRTLTRTVAAAAAVAAVSVAGVGTAHAALPPVSTFVVVTSFGEGSPIIEADGVWTGCTEVIDLVGSANPTGPRTLVFSGVKEVVCPDGNVILSYQASANWASGVKRTSGDWQILFSENPGINGGSGTVRGDSRGCDNCIVDTFSGRVV